MESGPGRRDDRIRSRSTSRCGEGRFFGLEASLADFVAALRTGGVPEGECHDNVQSLAMCHAAVESAAAGTRVPVAARLTVPRNLVNLKDVAKGYGSRSVLDDVTLGVAAGDRIGDRRAATATASRRCCG